MDRRKYTAPYQEISLIAAEFHQTNEGTLFSGHTPTRYSEFGLVNF
jgi:hypothetical protein